MHAASPSSPGFDQVSVSPPTLNSQLGQLIALPLRAQETPLKPSVAATSANLSSRANSLIACASGRQGDSQVQYFVRAPSSQKPPPILIRHSARPPTVRLLRLPLLAGLNLRDTYRCAQLAAERPTPLVARMAVFDRLRREKAFFASSPKKIIAEPAAPTA